MQRFSFDFGDPSFDLGGWHVALQITTFENTYGLDPDLTETRTTEAGWEVTASGLTWAGGQQKVEGRGWLSVNETNNGIRILAGAEHQHKIRSLKLIVRGLEAEELIGLNWEPRTIPPQGVVLRYPQLFLHTPLIFLRAGSDHLYFQSLDSRVRAKRFAVYRDGEALNVELIHEEAAPFMSNSLETPPWQIGITSSPESVAEDHARHIESAFGLRRWEDRDDVPGWAREIALVITLHGMHWTGYVFNDYARMLEALEWACERIEGRRVLAFLPGWEGRYYWQYGDYRPEPRLGGAKGFATLANGARRLGVTLMPMFGANCANTTLPGYETWGAPAVIHSPTGMEFQGNRPDWDASRSNDPGWQAWLNPGNPLWRNHLVEQVSGLLTEYGLRAVFFDTHHVWDNDPAYPVYEGVVALRDELRSRFDDLLVVGEGWYDALGAVTPVSHAGTPRQWDWFFGRYNRCFGHLMFGDPSRGSTGVHEAGHTGFIQVPDAAHWWPTLPIVDRTLELTPERAEAVIAQARDYARKYLDS